MAAFICACMGWKSSDGERIELSWRTASLCIEEPIAEGESRCYQIELKLDTLVGESDLAKNLAAVLRDSVIYVSGFSTVQEAMAAFADSTKAEWLAELAERYEPDSEYNEMLQYYYNVAGSAVETGRDDVLSYMATTDCYLGGAHGSHVVMYYNFDIKSGKLLSIKDVVPADREQEMLKQMEEQLCKDWDAKDIVDLQENTGITMLGELYLTNNFLLKNDSIEFLFNQYEIAPYAAGLISVTIPFVPNP
ncbi:MAG: DUF3298 domain-containing protein [Bacteroidaceae bacterium]|nr:DUF3298 domain-containing protein [Bacteroidaceae bacterium]